LDELEQADPYERRDQALVAFLDRVSDKLDGDVPTAEQVLADQAVYVALLERVCSAKEEECDLEFYRQVHDLFTDPPAMHQLTVTHLRAMWDEFLASEWEHNLPMLQESVTAFQEIDFSGMSCAEVVRRVTGRELVTECEKWQQDFTQIMFIPSAHIGPYVGIFPHDKQVKVVFGARVPAGVVVRSTELSRSELLMRLSALADETRLRILELLTSEHAQSSPEIMERLALSQSAASRHLRQLAATGFLSVERSEGAKVYRLSRQRIDDTCGALKKLVQRTGL
jgi:DNA-binding transcriptional ArsR family regulator